MQLDVVKLMFWCNVQVEICSTQLDVTLKLRDVFGTGSVDLGVINLQIVFGTMKVDEIAQE